MLIGARNADWVSQRRRQYPVRTLRPSPRLVEKLCPVGPFLRDKFSISFVVLGGCQPSAFFLSGWWHCPAAILLGLLPNSMKLTSLFLCCTSNTTIPSDDHEASVLETNDDKPVVPAAVTKPKPAKRKVPDPEPYSAARAEALFEQYADGDNASFIGPEGFERLCNDAEIPLEGALPLVLAWQVGASEMAKILKSEWDKATSELQYVSHNLFATLAFATA